MRKILFTVLLLSIIMTSKAQETYNVDGTFYELKTEVSGTIDLLWNIIDNEYRYFIKKDNIIIELINTKNDAKIYQEQYKTVLATFTADEALNTEDLKLTLPSLAGYINDYNALKNKDYVIEEKHGKVDGRLSVFGGATNSPFVSNPDNIINPVIGVEIEVFDANKLPSHSIYLKGRQVIASKAFDYSATQVSIGYRFRFIKSTKLSIYANIDIAQYSYTKLTKTIFIDDSFEDSIEKNNVFEVPFIFGLGVEYKLSERTFIHLAYDEIFALLVNNQDNFS